MCSGGAKSFGHRRGDGTPSRTSDGRLPRRRPKNPLRFEPVLEAVREGSFPDSRWQHVDFSLQRCEDTWRHKPDTAPGRARQIFAQTEPVEKWVVAGHSKGGKIAAELVHDDRSSIAALILIGTSHPKGFDLSNIAVPVKKIFASNDGVATLETIESTKRNLPVHTQWIEIEEAITPSSVTTGINFWMVMRQLIVLNNSAERSLMTLESLQGPESLTPRFDPGRQPDRE